MPRRYHHRVCRWASVAWLLVLPLCTKSAAPDPLEMFGVRASRGAAPGYLPDAACARCHATVAASFADVGMAQSFNRPLRGGLPADLAGLDYHHAASGMHYRLERRGDELWFRQTQDSAPAGSVRPLELRVDWALGSGHRAQSYLHQTAAGELYQLPVTWYAQSGALAMSPGYEDANHPGVERRVRRECMFCHNAYPQVDVGSDQPGQPDLFPSDLPHGIGCQRCHGPGEAHLRAVLTGAGLDAVHAAIVNPARLDWPARNDVCFQCHLLPAVEAIGPRRVGRGDYSFRPGERLSAYLLHVDIDDATQATQQRFQINHHAYRLQQSDCFRKSDGRMGCVSCHDPHVRRVGTGAVDWYRAKCLGCHEDLDRAHGQAADASLAGADARNCANCHMPQRRSQDVVEVTMTDHRIARGPFDSQQLIAALEPRKPQIRAMRLYDRDIGLATAESNAYRALAALNNGSGAAALDALQSALARMARPDPSWWPQLARYQVANRRYAAALASLANLPETLRHSPVTRETAALIAAGNGQRAAAIEIFVELYKRQGFHPEVDYNLGLLQRAAGQADAAIDAFQRLLEQRPLSAAGWLQLARTYWTTQQGSRALAALEQAQAIKPNFEEALLLREQIHKEAGAPSEPRH